MPSADNAMAAFIGRPTRIGWFFCPKAMPTYAIATNSINM
jgi:hypothetical protein